MLNMFNSRVTRTKFMSAYTSVYRMFSTTHIYDYLVIGGGSGGIGRAS